MQNEKTNNMSNISVNEALTKLIEKGADIKQIEADKFMVYDNGFFGFLNDEDPFTVDGEGIIEIYDMYC